MNKHNEQRTHLSWVDIEQREAGSESDEWPTRFIMHTDLRETPSGTRLAYIDVRTPNPPVERPDGHGGYTWDFEEVFLPTSERTPLDVERLRFARYLVGCGKMSEREN